MRAADERDAALVEQLPGGRGRGTAEELKRLVLRRHEHALDLRDAAPRDVRADEQRELIGGQRPDGAGGNGDGDTLNITAVELAEQLLDQVGVCRPAEGQRTG